MSNEASEIRKIIHVDMDAFYASVEQRDFPEYKGKALVVGGMPGKRGVVAAASYEARRFGIHSAMSSTLAARKCPDLIFVYPRFEVYKNISRQIREIFYEYTDLVEPMALDEAYLDVTENKMGLKSAQDIAREIKDKIKARTQLTASAGVSFNKFLAKTASGWKKPDGLTVIKPKDAGLFLEQLPIGKFYGVGKATAAKMKSLGIEHGAALKQWEKNALVKEFGKMGSYLYDIVRGIDHRKVESKQERKSLGAEETFEQDLLTAESMQAALQPIAAVVARRMSRYNQAAKTLSLKIKFSDFSLISRSRSFKHPIREEKDIYQAAIDILGLTDASNRPVRLLGITLSNFAGESAPGQGEQISLALF